MIAQSMNLTERSERTNHGHEYLRDSRAEDIPHARVKTLVVDDSPFMLKILAQILEEAGNFDLVGATCEGCQAPRYVSTLSPELVLMDLHMPYFNGLQATRDIKQREQPPVIIIVTSDDSPVAKAKAEQVGADGFVIKQGDLRHRLLSILQDLFGPNGARRAKTDTALRHKFSPQETRTLKKATP
jgi:DNA-binding NarL/FixJ family response regulator